MIHTQVLELIRQYGGEPPDAPMCRRCKTTMFVGSMTSDGCEFGCHCGHVEFIKRDRPYDLDVVTLAQDYIALLQQIAKESKCQE